METKKRSPDDFVPYTIAAMIQMGVEMREAADKYPAEESPVYSNTECEAVERSRWQVENPDKCPRNGMWQVEVGLCRVIDRRRDDHCIISVEMSKDTYCTPHRYHISMVRITGPGPTFAAVPPLDAALIAACLLGQKAAMIPNPSGIEMARHYIREIEGT
jgi:hypothetical protein